MLAVFAAALAGAPSGTWTLDWDRESTRYQPRHFRGLLDLDSEQLSFAESNTALTVSRVVTHDDGTFYVEFHWNPAEPVRMGGWADGDELAGWLRYPGWPLQPIRGTRVDLALLQGVPEGVPTTTPEAAGLDPNALMELLRMSQVDHSSGIVILKDGEVVLHHEPIPGRHNIHSITKPVAALAVPLLLEDSAATLDTPLATWIPEWASPDPRSAITLRHVLTHTTGLEHQPDPALINQHGDRAALVRGSPLVDPPGTTFGYSNRAMGLLPMVVERATGTKIDDYVAQRVLRPAGIAVDWPRDKAGSPVAFGGVATSVLDLARIGQLFLDEGRVGAKRVLPEGWVAESTALTSIAPARTRSMGLCWFRDERTGSYGHTGGGGQFLQVYPRQGIVFARLHQTHEDDEHHSGARLLRAVHRLATP